MMAKRRRVITNNKELYDKLNMLAFSNDVVVKTASLSQINKILKNVNKYSNNVQCEKIGNYFLLKREGPLNLSVYYSKK